MLSEPLPPHNPGGAGKLSQIFLTGLKNLNCLVNVICIDKKKNETFRFSEHITVQRIHIEEWEWKVETFNERRNKVLPVLEELHLTNNYDILYDMGGFLYFDIVREFAVKHKILIFTHFLILLKPYLKHANVPKYMIDLFHDLQILQAKSSNFVITTSISEQVYYRKNFGSLVSEDFMIHNAVHLPEVSFSETIEKELPKDHLLLFFGGRISDKLKGIDRAVALFKQIKKIRPATKLVLNNTLTKDLGDIGLDDEDFILFGRLPEPEFYSLLCQVDIVLCPSYYEAFGMLAIEGGLCGAYIIASSLGGHLDTVNNYVDGMLIEDEYWYDMPKKHLDQIVNIQNRSAHKLMEVPEKIAPHNWTLEIYQLIEDKLKISPVAHEL